MKHLLLLSAAVGMMFYLARGTVIFGPYTYDEPDYMYAVSLGWMANATDSPTLPLADFLSIGLDRGRGADARTDLSEMIRDSGDVLFYRHWHGPIYSGWLALVRSFTANERSMREWNVVFPIAAAAAMYFGALWLLPGAAGQAAAILASVLYLWSYPVVRTTELAPHQLFAACAAAALLMMARMFADPAHARGYWYAAVLVSALAFCVLEIAFALILALLICGYLLRDSLKPGAAFVLRSAGLFAAAVLALWPGAVLKLSFVKAYLFMAYLAVFRPNAWGAVGLGETWWLRVEQSPVPWILAVLGLLYFLRRRQARVLVPFVVFILTMSAAIFPVKTTMARYSLALWPGLVLLSAFSASLAMEKWKPRVRLAAVAILCAAMVATGWPSLRSDLPRRDARTEAMLALIRDRGLAQKSVLVPHEDLPTLHYYFSGSRFKSYYDESAIPEQLRKGGIEGVVDRSDPPRWIPAPGTP